MSTLCLTMVVKNEAHNIIECLKSCIDYIKEGIIVDNGSGDDTRELAEKFFYMHARICGTYLSAISNNMGALRTESMYLSQNMCDYRLVFDADNRLEVIDPTVFDNLTADCYMIYKKQGNVTFPVWFMFRSDKEFVYNGVIHEFPTLRDGTEFTCETLPEDKVLVHEPEKINPDKDKYYRDARNIESELNENENLTDLMKTRYWFYLGQSYRDAGLYDLAIRAYQVRAKMGGWYEEVYYSLLQVARIHGSMHPADLQGIIFRYYCAWEVRPARTEAALELMKLLYDNNFFHWAWSIALVTRAQQPCTDILFPEPDTAIWFENLYQLIITKLNR